MAMAMAMAMAEPYQRDLAHYKTRLARAHPQLGDPEQAVQVATEAHTIAGQIGSARANERFFEPVTKLEHYDVPEVHALVEAIRPQ
jgi:predicted Zn-dependent protease